MIKHVSKDARYVVDSSQIVLYRTNIDVAIIHFDKTATNIVQHVNGTK